jgi:hypothetical protein
MMKRVIIQLEHETHNQLRRIAYEEEKFISELCRELIEDWLKNRKEGK